MLSRAIRGGKRFLTQKLPVNTAARYSRILLTVWIETRLRHRELTKNWLRGRDLNPRPSGYEPDELPGCSTPHFESNFDIDVVQIEKAFVRSKREVKKAILLAFAAGCDFVDA
jgi:hypothetical protein